jgi:hypothetical protein
MDEASRALVHYAHTLTRYADAAVSAFRRVPGSDMLARYVRSSYQNDPVRSVIEAALVLFCLVYVLRTRFSTERSRVVLSEDVGISEFEVRGLTVAGNRRAGQRVAARAAGRAADRD